MSEQPPDNFIKEFSDYNPILRQLLYTRNLKSAKQIEAFLRPRYEALHDPFLFADMSRLVSRIYQAIDTGENIIIHGDYDADGVTSTAVMYETLKALGARVDVFIPHREKDGYGLRPKTIDRLINEGYKLLITVDCGVTNVAEVKMAMDAGLDVIVTDHHEPLDILPEPLALINPKVDPNYPFQYLCGAGVAFKVATALIKNYHGSDSWANYGGPEGFLKWLLDLVAIGTVADVMPLVDENRVLVNYGLIVLRQTRRPGIRKLAAEANIDLAAADSYTIGYQIAPRLNAAGRIEHAREAFELLTTMDEDEAYKLAHKLQETNLGRQKITDEVMITAKEKLVQQEGQKMLFLYDENWHPGVVGLVAGRIAEDYYRPVLVMTMIDGQIVGSGRSISDFNITEELMAAEKYLARYGGHAAACGFTLKNKDELADFTSFLADRARQSLTDEHLIPIIYAETELAMTEINLDLAERLKTLSPFGEGNEKPRFILRDLMVTSLDLLGDKEQHLRLMVRNGHSPAVKKVMGFGLGKTWGGVLNAGDKIDLMVELSVNEWNGSRNVEMKIVDLKLKA